MRILILLIASVLAMADHLPARHIAKGRSEQRLAGFDLSRTTAAKIVELLGKPSRTGDFPISGTAYAEREFVWSLGGVEVRVMGDTQSFDQPPSSITVDGVKPGERGRTGRGLALGMALADAVRIYGNRFLDTRVPSGVQRTFEWQDGTSLQIEADARGRIVHIQLVVPE